MLRLRLRVISRLRLRFSTVIRSLSPDLRNFCCHHCPHLTFETANMPTANTQEGQNITVKVLHPFSAEARVLLDASSAYMGGLYPLESIHLVDASELMKPHAHFLGAYQGSECLGCGAMVVVHDAAPPYGEVKRVFVHAQHRRRGVAQQLMYGLEAYLRMQGILLARLETGIWQPQAVNLYKKLGYVPIAPFGAYGADPLSIFMEKTLC